MGGNIVGFGKLVQHLRLDQPVYGIESQAFNARERALLRIEEMATFYIGEIRAIQRHGPYCFLGYSFGGMVAFEMAQQLSSQGEHIAMLGLLDTLRHVSFSLDSHGEAGSSSAVVRKARRLSDHLRRLTAGPNRGEYLRQKLTARVLRTVYTVCAAGGLEVPRSLLSAFDINWFAAVNYKPLPYAGRITLFRAIGDNPVGRFTSDLGWCPYAQGGSKYNRFLASTRAYSRSRASGFWRGRLPRAFRHAINPGYLHCVEP